MFLGELSAFRVKYVISLTAASISDPSIRNSNLIFLFSQDLKAGQSVGLLVSSGWELSSNGMLLSTGVLADDCY